MTRRQLAFAICALIVVGVVLYVVLRSGSDTRDAPPQTAASGATPADRLRSSSQPRSASQLTDAGSAVGSATQPEPPARPSINPHSALDREIGQVDDAFTRGDLNKAHALAAKVLEAHPGEPHMLQVMAYVGCAHHELKEAITNYKALTDPADRARVQSLCQRRGVDLEKLANH